MPQKRVKAKQSQRPKPKPKQNVKKTKTKSQRMVVPKQPQSKIGNGIAGLGSAFGNLWTQGEQFVDSITGWGAYKLKQNSIMDGSGVPTMHTSNDAVILRHREYIGDISCTSAFTTTSYNVNPGLSTTFPFLSNVAANFQEYSFRGLVFDYVPTSSDVISGTNTALGTVSLAAQYRSDLGPFTSKVQMLNSEFSVDGKPSHQLLFPVECSPKERPMNIQYVRTGPTANDLKFYDLCELTVATAGSQTTNVVGELWATYEIELYKPTLESGAGGSDELFYVAFTGSAPTNTDPCASMNVYNCSAIGLQPAYGPSATTLSIATYNTRTGGAFANISAGVDGLLLPPGLVGMFCATYWCLGDSTAQTIVPVITVAGATLQAIQQGTNSTLENAPLNADTGKTCMVQAFFSISQAQAVAGACTINIGKTNVILPANPTRMNFTVAQVWANTITY